MKTFIELEQALTELSSPGIQPGLERPARLLAALGHPERSFKAIHLLGTNGKGSTAATLESVLLSAGQRVALYTSPHLESLAERLRVDGAELPVESWWDALLKLEECIRGDDALSQNPPTYFENLTALAFLLIRQSGVKLVVLEAGMGGRYDVTNLAPNILVTLITPIGLDHCAFLGDTLAAVAHEKFSAVRRGVPAVYAANDAALSQQFLECCAQVGAEGYLLPDLVLTANIQCNATGTTLRLLTEGEEPFAVTTPLMGTHQAQNLALAYAALHGLLSDLYPISRAQWVQGIAATHWPGRFERVRENPPLILDGGHNPHAISRLVETVELLRDQIRIDALLFATMEDKDYVPSLHLLKQLKIPLYLTEIPDMPRCESVARLKEQVQTAGLDVKGVFPRPEQAIIQAQEQQEGLLCIGSLFLVGYIKSFLSKNQ